MQALDGRTQVHFGQLLSEIEKLVGESAVADESPIARKGKDCKLYLPGVELWFDSGLLFRMAFREPFDFTIPIQPFPERWRDLDPIGDKKIAYGMPKGEFLEYLEAWEARAKDAGATRSDGPNLLRAQEYSISMTNDDFIDMVHIGFGPERPTGKGGSWGDGCHVAFLSQKKAALLGKAAGRLESISVSCDAFNTRARHK